MEALPIFRVFNSLVPQFRFSNEERNHNNAFVLSEQDVLVIRMIILGVIIVLYPVWKTIGLKYYRWRTSPLRNVPGPSSNKSSFFLGSFPSVWKEPFMQPHQRWVKECSTTNNIDKDVPILAYSGIFGRYTVLVLDADIVQDVLCDLSVSKEIPNIRFMKKYDNLKLLMGEGLVTLEGGSWSRHRRIIQPSFQTSLLESTLDEVVPLLTHKLIRYWKIGHKNNRIIDVDTHFQALTLDIIGQAGFSYEFEALNALEGWVNETTTNRESGPPKKDLAATLKPIGAIKIDHPFVAALHKRILRPSLLDFFLMAFQLSWMAPYLNPVLAKNQRELDEQAERVVLGAKEKLLKQHGSEEANTKNKSLLQLLLNASSQNETTTDGIGASLKDEKDTFNTSSGPKRNVLSLIELRDEVKTFLIAGHETTSTWCYWAMYALAKNLEVQEKLFKDIVQHDSTKGEAPIGLHDVEKMEYLAIFLDEVLRLYPPVGMVIRYATNEETWHGHKIPANTRLVIPIYMLHRLPKYWGDDAEIFRPERWLPETEDEIGTGTTSRKKRHPLSFIPFSAGLRNCIGYRFARIEAKIIVANLVREFYIKLAPCMPPEISLTAIITMKSKPLVKICVEERKK